jgi:hypothetical protein
LRVALIVGPAGEIAAKPGRECIQVSAAQNAACAGLARYMQRAFLHQGATLTNSRKNACHDDCPHRAFSQVYIFGLDCEPRMGNG